MPKSVLAGRNISTEILVSTSKQRRGITWEWGVKSNRVVSDSPARAIGDLLPGRGSGGGTANGTISGFPNFRTEKPATLARFSSYCAVFTPQTALFGTISRFLFRFARKKAQKVENRAKGKGFKRISVRKVENRARAGRRTRRSDLVSSQAPRRNRPYSLAALSMLLFPAQVIRQIRHRERYLTTRGCANHARVYKTTTVLLRVVVRHAHALRHFRNTAFT